MYFTLNFNIMFREKGFYFVREKDHISDSFELKNIQQYI